MVNNGTAIIYVGFDSSVSASNGIPILPSGNYINTSDGECYKSSWYGITASLTSDLRFEEWTP